MTEQEELDAISTPLGAEALSEGARGYALSDKPGRAEQFVGGAKHAWDKAAHGLASIFGDESQAPLVEQGKAFVKETGPWSTGGQIAGDVAMSAAPSVRAMQAARAVAPAIKSLPLAADMAAQGGYGALTNPEDRSGGATSGAIGAGVGHALAKTISRGLPGVSQEARRLMDTSGVQPTVGMAVPKLRAVEEFSQRVPLIGEFTKSARNRAVNEFTDEGIRKAVGSEVFDKFAKGTPEEMLNQANDFVGRQYDRVVPYIKPSMDHLLSMEERYRQVMSRPYMSESERNAIDRIFKPVLKSVDDYKRIQANPMGTAEQRAAAGESVLGQSDYGKWRGEDIKQFDSELGAQIRKYYRSPSTVDLGDALYTIQQGLRESIEKTLPEDLQGIMGGANQAYRNLMAVNRAAGENVQGQLTPRRLNKAIAARDKVEPTQTRGNLADFAKTSQRVLPASVADPHLSGAGLTAGLLGVGGGAMTGHLPAVLGAAGVAGLGSTRAAQSMLLGNTRVQRAMAEALRKYPHQGAVGAAMSNEE